MAKHGRIILIKLRPDGEYDYYPPPADLMKKQVRQESERSRGRMHRTKRDRFDKALEEECRRRGGTITKRRKG